ncbi:hypothetical protein ACPA9J_32980 [Pseudomonas aeruginosa]
MQALRARHPDIEFIGVGGPRLEAEGLSSYFPMERPSVMGLVEVLGRLPELLRRRKRLIRTLIEARPDVMIGIDAPRLHPRRRTQAAPGWPAHRALRQPFGMGLAAEAGAEDSRSLRPDAGIVPLRSTFLRRAWGARAFRRPHSGQHHSLQADRAAARARLGLPADGQVLALMPGSRGGEVGKLAPLFLDTAQRLLVERPGLRFVLPCASAARREQIEQMLQGREPLPLTLLDGASP